MNGALLLGISIVFFVAAYFIYGRYLSRLFGIDKSRETPAHANRDGVDYVPAKFSVLFGHHFASIAGAGPILGPIMAAFFGWVPVVIWIFLGCVFVGAMHDFAALFVSVRNGGRSIGHVVEKHLGYTGRQMFLLFSWAALVLVVAIFAKLVAGTFAKTPSVATASLLFIAMAPCFGVLVHKKYLSVVSASFIFVPLMFFFIWVGVKFPLDLTSLLGITDGEASLVWLLVLMIYVFIASTIPVWMLLQPRDYLNSYLLYAMILVGFAGIFFTMPELKMDAFSGWHAVKPDGSTGGLFPLLFVIVACGACSGFHALVSSGTTSKQISDERDILPVGYGGMLVEGVLAIMALISVAVLPTGDYLELLGKQGTKAVVIFSSGLAGLATNVGLPLKIGSVFISMSISAFMLTTLDTATRLTRFTWQELFLPKSADELNEEEWRHPLIANPFVATLMIILFSSFLATSGSAGHIWSVFGASNQLLAALTLLVLTLILVKKKANFWITLIPMLFMVSITCWALVILLKNNIGKNTALVIVTGFLLVMGAVLIVKAVFSLRKIKAENRV